MAYLKPPLLVRAVFNKVAMRFGLGGSSVLAVARRGTGTEQTIPVIAVEHDGALHVVSTRGESAWVRNLRAAGTCELRGRGTRAGRYTAEEIPVEQRGPIIEAYRGEAGRTVESYWKRLPDPDDHPTFCLTPA